MGGGQFVPKLTDYRIQTKCTTTFGESRVVCQQPIDMSVRFRLCCSSCCLCAQTISKTNREIRCVAADASQMWEHAKAVREPKRIQSV